MSDAPVSIPLLLGTNRSERESGAVAAWVMRQMSSRDDIETHLFDVRDFELPQDGYGPVLADSFPEWRDAITRADGLVIVTPEYNHSFPGILKSVLDILLKEYIHKAVGFVGVSAGPFGGTRVIESMLPVVRELGLTATFTDLHFPRVRTAFNDAGEPVDEKYADRCTRFLDELVWMSRTLRWGRSNL